jgi:hypothetical protein
MFCDQAGIAAGRMKASTSAPAAKGLSSMDAGSWKEVDAA